jgi:hypothetical protein
MNRSDDDIRKFFDEMRRHDNQAAIPEFDELTKNHKRPRSRKLYFIPLGAAASLLIALGVYFSIDKETDDQVNGELVIIFSEEKAINTQSLISEESSIDSWKAPSDFLIDDFKNW